MKRFIAIYHAPPELLAQSANVSPEDRDESMKAWFAWKEKRGDAVVDFGAPLVGGISVHQDGTSRDSTKEVAGYSVIQAENKEKAIALFEGHPHLSWHPDAYIEIHETTEI